MEGPGLLLAVGAGAFGVFIGFIVRYFLERFERYDVKELSALVGVPLASILVVFLNDFGSHSRPSYTIGLVLGLVLYQAFYSKFPSLPMRSQRESPFTVISAANTLVLHDKVDASATWERRQEMRFNREMKEALITEVRADGALGPVRLTAAQGRVVSLDRRDRAGVSRMYAVFNTSVKQGETAEVALTIELVGAFTNDSESIEHVVLNETEEITFEVRFPDDRLYRAAELVKVFGSQETGLSRPRPDGNILREVVPGKIKIAEAYRLDWNW